MYNNSSISANTLYSGDRTGSHYFMMLEPTTGTYLANKDSGRFNAGMRNRINAIMINPFLKFKGLELFGSYETVKGGAYSETDDRKWNQLAVEGLYRFAANEQLYIGGRYISAKGRPQGAAFTQDVTINRTAFVAGWFPTKTCCSKAKSLTRNILISRLLISKAKANSMVLWLKR